MPTIPLEIIDMITDWVYESKNPVEMLKACSTVSKQFYPRAQKNLFAFITVHFLNTSAFPATSSPPGHAAQPLLNVLLVRPELARYIKHLNILGFSEGYWLSNECHPDDDIEDSEEFYDAPDTVLPRLFDIISRYTNLESFCLSGPSDISDAIQSHYDRKFLSQDLKCALLWMFASTRVPRISLSLVSGISLTSIADLCPELKQLRVECTSVYDVNEDEDMREEDEDDAEMDSVQAEPGHLETLSLDDRSVLCVRKLMKHCVDCASSPLTLSHLRELSVKGTSSSLQSVASDLISHALESIESFNWQVKGTFSFDLMRKIEINLSPATALRTLRFGFPDCDSVEWAFLPQLLNLLAPLHSRNNLQMVLISYMARAMPTPTIDLDRNAWASGLCSHLACHKAFPHLRNVTVVVEYYEEEWNAMDGEAPLGNAMLALAKRLSALRERGVLKIEWVAVQPGNKRGLERALDARTGSTC